MEGEVDLGHLLLVLHRANRTVKVCIVINGSSAVHGYVGNSASLSQRSLRRRRFHKFWFQLKSQFVEAVARDTLVGGGGDGQRRGDLNDVADSDG